MDAPLRSLGGPRGCAGCGAAGCGQQLHNLCSVWLSSVDTRRLSKGEQSSRVLSRTSEDLYPTGSFCSDTEIDNRLAWLRNITLIKGGSKVQSFVDAYFAPAAHINVSGGSGSELRIAKKLVMSLTDWSSLIFSIHQIKLDAYFRNGRLKDRFPVTNCIFPNSKISCTHRIKNIFELINYIILNALIIF